MRQFLVARSLWINLWLERCSIPRATCEMTCNICVTFNGGGFGTFLGFGLSFLVARRNCFKSPCEDNRLLRIYIHMHIYVYISDTRCVLIVLPNRYIPWSYNEDPSPYKVSLISWHFHDSTCGTCQSPSCTQKEQFPLWSGELSPSLNFPHLVLLLSHLPSSSLLSLGTLHRNPRGLGASQTADLDEGMISCLGQNQQIALSPETIQIYGWLLMLSC